MMTKTIYIALAAILCAFSGCKSKEGTELEKRQIELQKQAPQTTTTSTKIKANDAPSISEANSPSADYVTKSDSIFDSTKWQYHDEDNSFFRESLRKAMIKDLRANHSVLNRSYEQIVARLGQPNYIDSSGIFTAVYTLQFGWNSSMEYKIMFDTHRLAKSDKISRSPKDTK